MWCGLTSFPLSYSQAFILRIKRQWLKDKMKYHKKVAEYQTINDVVISGAWLLHKILARTSLRTYEDLIKLEEKLIVHFIKQSNTFKTLYHLTVIQDLQLGQKKRQPYISQCKHIIACRGSLIIYILTCWFVACVIHHVCLLSEVWGQLQRVWQELIHWCTVCVLPSKPETHIVCN